jgi:hypothetical protein
MLVPSGVPSLHGFVPAIPEEGAQTRCRLAKE